MASIQVNGKDISLLLNVNAIIEFKKQTGKNLFAWFQESFAGIQDTANLDFEGLRALVYSCFYAACVSEKKPVSFTIEEVGEWLDIFNPESLTQIFEAITSQIPKQESKKKEAKVMKVEK